MLSISDFSERFITDDSLKKLFELNPNRKEYTEVITPDYPQYKYLFVENLHLNPYDIRDYLMNSSYIASTNLLVKEKTGAPGMQQPIGNEWVKNYLLYCRESLLNHKITKKAIRWQDFQCYCNIFWASMKSMNSNYRPHVDPGDMAFNYFLSDDLDSSDGTGMYSINIDGNEWMDVRHLQTEVEKRPDRDQFLKKLEKVLDKGRVGVGKTTNYQRFDGDENFTLKGVVPSGFNCLSAYRGSVYHSAFYDPTKYPDDHCRYSLVAMLALTMPGVGNSFQKK